MCEEREIVIASFFVAETCWYTAKEETDLRPVTEIIWAGLKLTRDNRVASVAQKQWFVYFLDK